MLFSTSGRVVFGIKRRGSTEHRRSQRGAKKLLSSTCFSLTNHLGNIGSTTQNEVQLLFQNAFKCLIRICHKLLNCFKLQCFQWYSYLSLGWFWLTKLCWSICKLSWLHIWVFLRLLNYPLFSISICCFLLFVFWYRLQGYSLLLIV